MVGIFLLVFILGILMILLGTTKDYMAGNLDETYEQELVDGEFQPSFGKALYMRLAMWLYAFPYVVGVIFVIFVVIAIIGAALN
ncbi:MAG: hypothetical protein DWQ35_13940 [Planctomycetota bacterium]|nr:MAG: hypothetical protein DWQ35_13940 [Planctomycetota bacterium]REK25955.1 MAG: hypothetical protein DWQ42_10015 [Planctomycetota bacterium]REK46929.1 MAG: hypothetical protein DWQ46_05385 [Planctomycetota bacterium]